jgi:hypothetical protein
MSQRRNTAGILRFVRQADAVAAKAAPGIIGNADERRPKRSRIPHDSFSPAEFGAVLGRKKLAGYSSFARAQYIGYFHAIFTLPKLKTQNSKLKTWAAKQTIRLL